MSACFTHPRTAVSVRSRSRDTLATVFPGWRTSSTTSALNSLVNDRRRRCCRPIVSIVDILSGAPPLIVDVRQTGSGPWIGQTGNVVVSSPAVTGGMVYVGSEDGKLYVFRQTPDATCSGVPLVCPPLWTATLGGPVLSSPAVVNGIVYVGADKLYAFDATGTTNCSGVPKTCAALWTTGFLSGGAEASPTISANNVLYVLGGGGVFYAFDGAGTTNCGGTPKVCNPLWSVDLGGNDGRSSAAIANGMVYVGSFTGRLYAFKNTSSCSGTCSPLWTAPMGTRVWSSPAVDNKVVYIGSDDGNLYAFDGTGTTNCSGSPKTCAPLWTAATGGLDISLSSPAVANGVVYLGSTDGKLYAFDATGTTNCSGTPKTCAPVWTAPTTAEIRHSSPAVANGVVYVGSQDHNLYAFAADGTTNCAGTPKTCSPLWVAPTGAGISSSPTIANGWVYVGSLDHDLYAYTLGPS